MSGLYVYLTRIIPALSVVAVIVLLVFAFCIAPYGQIVHGKDHGEATISQLILSVYTVFLHLVSVNFAVRVNWAMGNVIKNVKEAANIVEKPKKRKNVVVKSGTNKIAYPLPVFVIIIPAYKEEMQTLQETLRVLASHPQARHAYHIYLAMEEKEKEAAQKATTLIEIFQARFYNMSFTIHPSNIPGEAQGKSSNESWAANIAIKHYPDEVKSNVVVTVMDADTHLSHRYFDQVGRHHFDSPLTNQETVHVPPLVFDRNLHNVPLPVRTADLLWAGAGISSLYSGSAVGIPTSVYSLPMTLVERVGGWDTGPDAIGEDMHMYLKCFFALSGNLKAHIVYAATSQCDVSSNVQGFKGYIGGLRARYKQALRHMWGSMDTGYAVRQMMSMVAARFRESEYVESTTFLGLLAYCKDIFLETMSSVCAPNWNSYTNGTITKRPFTSKSSSTLKSTNTPTPINYLTVYILFHRLFEAHFLPIHLSIILTTSTVYDWVTGNQIPHEFRQVLFFCDICRWIGWVLMCIFLYRYSGYHRLCVALRKEEMRKAGILEELEDNDGFSPRALGSCGIVEAGLFPLGGVIFGAVPALQAIISHVFTDKLTYQVSLKPQFSKVQPWKAKSESTFSSRPQSPTCKIRPPDALRKQLNHMASGAHFNRPVKRKD